MHACDFDEEEIKKKKKKLCLVTLNYGTGEFCGKEIILAN
jgi:hypothetical protein